MGHTFSNNLYHIIFSTKDRCGPITDNCRDDLHQYICGIARKLDCSIIKINTIIDHAHLLCVIRPAISVSDFVNKVKANSSHWIKDRFDLPFGFQWQNGFSSFSVSESCVQQVIQYIEYQQEHHKKISYEEELRSFLDKHGVKYDPLHYLD